MSFGQCIFVESISQSELLGLGECVHLASVNTDQQFPKMTVPFYTLMSDFHFSIELK